MRYVAALLLVLHVGVAFAGEPGPRVPVEQTGSSVEHPKGWTLAPASSSPPAVIFHLCDPAMTEGCMVQGEMILSAPNPERETPALQTFVAGADLQPGLPPPRLLKSGRYDAVETRWLNPQNPVRHASAGADMQIDTPQGRFGCSLMMPPDRIGQQIENWHRFCASLDVADPSPDARKHG